MSGMKTMANAIANDPSFASKTSGLMSKQEAAQFVAPGTGPKVKPVPMGKKIT